MQVKVTVAFGASRWRDKRREATARRTGASRSGWGNKAVPHGGNGRSTGRSRCSEMSPLLSSARPLRMGWTQAAQVNTTITKMGTYGGYCDSSCKNLSSGSLLT